MIPGIRIVVVFPRQDQASVFANSRLMPTILDSPVIRRVLVGKKPRQRYGRLWIWTIGRTASRGMVFSRIKKRRIMFPRLEVSRSFLDEIWCDVAEYDDQKRSIKYMHPESQPDDALHAINYAGTRAQTPRRQHGLPVVPGQHRATSTPNPSTAHDRAKRCVSTHGELHVLR